MRVLSVFLVACFLFLSSMGMVKPIMVPGSEMKMHCPLMSGMHGKFACQQKHSKDKSKGCDKQGCVMMLSCSSCGFFGVEAMRLKSTPANAIPKPIPLYKIGDLSAYYASDWKPPKAC